MHGAKSKKQGARSLEQGAWSKERGARSREQLRVDGIECEHKIGPKSV
jgi:hypothetical protein